MPSRRTERSACATRVRTSSRLTRLTRSPNATFSNTLMCGNSAYDWNTMLTCRLAGGTRVTSPPRSRMRPLVGSSKPAIMRSVVVLPQPDGPSIEKNSPSWISNETASTATTVVEALRHRLEDDRFGGSLRWGRLGSSGDYRRSLTRAPADAQGRRERERAREQERGRVARELGHRAGERRGRRARRCPSSPRATPSRRPAPRPPARRRRPPAGSEAVKPIACAIPTATIAAMNTAVPNGSAIAPIAGREQQRAEADES